MRVRRCLLLLVASALLMGSKSQETEALIKRCVERGNDEKTCRCVLELQEEFLGHKFIEAEYLQLIGDQRGYDKKLLEVIAENPRILRDLASVEARAKDRCVRK